MGFFSKTCAKTHVPICVPEKCERLSYVVVLYPDGKKVEGQYDGYGRVNGVDLLEDCSSKEWYSLKFVWREKYQDETYADLGKSHEELAQGYFMDRDFLRYCLLNEGFKSHAEYKKYFKKLAGWI